MVERSDVHHGASPDASEAGRIETIIECVDLDAMVAFFIDEVGGRIELITPADDPAETVVSVHGARFRLVRADADVPVRLRLDASDGTSGRSLTAPNGSVVDVVPASGAAPVPPNEPSLSIVHAADDDEFGVGRAGMGYRDLLPDRWGGRFIASHILIADGGDVADYVHFHRIRFQMIFVAAGWVDVVYEDQGEPFRMVAGDCVLQPPEIRHRVLRSSPGLEVIEIGCPAEHDTLVEHDITLPTSALAPDRDFGGQRFVRHRAAAFDTASAPANEDGFVHRDTGIAGATDGLADVQVLTVATERRAIAATASPQLEHDGEFALAVVLDGTAVLSIAGADDDDRRVAVGERDAVAFPPGVRWTWEDRSSDLEVLQVVMPSGAVTISEVGNAE